MTGKWKKCYGKFLAWLTIAAMIASMGIPSAAYASETYEDGYAVESEVEEADAQEASDEVLPSEDAEEEQAVYEEAAETAEAAAYDAAKTQEEYAAEDDSEYAESAEESDLYAEEGAEVKDGGEETEAAEEADEENEPSEDTDEEVTDAEVQEAEAAEADEQEDSAQQLYEEEAAETKESVAFEASLDAEEADPEVAYRDGAYEGTGYGRNGSITMRVTIADGKISAIDTVSQEEDEEYWADAVAVTDSIIASQKTDVDSISGATMSSDGIKEAVANALAKAVVPEMSDAFQSGAGTAANPYIILTADQLAAFAVLVDEGNTFEGVYIALGADIDLSALDEWNPIGAEGAPNSNKDKIFNGSFDGAGYAVSGMKISGVHADWQNAGFFSTLNTLATVKNLTLSDVSIDVTAESTTRIGGLTGDTIGNNSGIAAVIDSVSVSGSLTLISSNDSMLFAGGIAGRTMAGAVITNSWTDVSIDAEAQGAGYPSAYAGGIVGMAGNNTAIVNDASFGAVYGATPQGDTLVGYSGGIAGMFPGYLWNAYATGDITNGRADGSAHSWIGALVGDVTTKASADYLYYASDAALTLEAWSGDSHTDSVVTGASGSSTKTTTFLTLEAKEVLTRAEMSEESFADTLNGNLQGVYELLRDKELDGTVQLRTWVLLTDGKVVPTGENWYTDQPNTAIFASGTGTEEDPFLIATEEQLFAFAASLGENMNYTGYTVALDADLDISDKDWTPVGLSEYGFGGTFDGQGHTISGMHKGTEEEAVSLEDGQPYFALFGVLEKGSVVKNVSLTDVFVNVTYSASSYVAGIAGYMASVSSDTGEGARIDNCHVSGRMTSAQDRGNLFLAGIAAYQYKGAVTNCSSDVALSGTVKAGDLAEVGGIAALINRGLVANCYALGSVYASGNRENDNEGMGVASSLVAVDAGAVAGCYVAGDVTTKEFSTYAGVISGWVTGIGKAYSCWYDGNAAMTVNGESVKPVETIGTRVPGGVSEDGLVYTGGVTDDLNGYTAETYEAVADKLNEKFAEYPIDITYYGIAADALNTWTVKDSVVTFAEGTGTITYVQPEAEKYVKPEAELQDGTWYGRDDDRKSVVKITVEDAVITGTEVLTGESSGDAYEAAYAKAQEKAQYGDFSDYEAADPSKFAGGKGTEASPYLITTAEQLAYLSASVNSDNSWEGVWFRQTADISLAGMDFRPIGWALEGEIDNKYQTYCAYPFCGNFDGAGYTISGLTIGSAESPSYLMTLGLFGLTSGEYTTNEVPTESTRRVVLKNIHIRDAAVYGKAQNQLYAGTLLGSGQEGIEIDHCDATGIVSGETSDSHCRAGGLAASGLRGKMTNCWTDVEVNAVTDAGNVYAGGLTAMSNRLTIVNAYTLGPVTGGAGANNKTFIGGLDGMEGGIHINCYSRGDVTSTKTTAGIGANNGLVGGISVNKTSYYNSDALLTAAGSLVEMKASGANYGGATDEAAAKTAEEIGSAAFAEELNANIAGIAAILASVNEELEGGSHLVYYTGDGSDLAQWTAVDGIVQFAEDTQEIAGLKAQYDKVYGDKAFNLGASAKTALSYSSSNAKVAAVDGSGKVTVGNPGTAVITVSAAGNAQYGAVSKDVKVVVAKAASTVTLKNKSAVYTGKAIAAATAAVKGSTGKVTYKYYSDAKCTKAVTSAVNAGTYYVKASVAADTNYKAATSAAAKLTVKKAAQKVKSVTKSLTFKYSEVKKKAQKKSLNTKITAAGKAGKVTYKKKSGNKKITVSKAGKVTVRKGLKKGTYKIKVKVTAAATKNLKKKTVMKTIKIKVK